MTATLTSAVAQKDARIVNTRNGERLVCDFRTVNGEDITLWKPTNDAALAAIKRNQSVKLVKDSKGWNLVVDESSAPSPVAAPQASTDTLSPEVKKAIASHIETLADMYSFTYKAVCSRLGDADPVVLAHATDSLFDAACRKFNP